MTPPISLASVTPQEGAGGYQAAAGAIPYDRSPYEAVSSSSSLVSFGSLTVTSPYQGNSIVGSITMAMPVIMDNKMDKGVLFAVRGGMIVNSLFVDSLMPAGGSYVMANIPGGSPSMPMPGAFYGIDAVGWTSSPSIYRAIAIPQVVDLRTGSYTANLQMLPLC